MELTLDHVKESFCNKYCQVQCDGWCDLKGMVESAFSDPLFAIAYRARPDKAMEMLFERMEIEEPKNDSKRPHS